MATVSTELSSTTMNAATTTTARVTQRRGSGAAMGSLTRIDRFPSSRMLPTHPVVSPCPARSLSPHARAPMRFGPRRSRTRRRWSRSSRRRPATGRASPPRRARAYRCNGTPIVDANPSRSCPPIIGVSMMPGWIEFTLIPCGPSSMAAPLVMPRTAHFVAAYVKQALAPRRPPTDEMFTIEPDRCEIICGATLCMPRNTPVWFTATTSFQDSNDVSTMRSQRRIPALLIRMSRRPHSSTTRETSALHCAGSATSCSTNVPPISAAVFAPSSVSTSVTKTVAPSSPKSRASAAPCPRAPPVTIATRPSSLPMVVAPCASDLVTR